MPTYWSNSSTAGSTSTSTCSNDGMVAMMTVTTSPSDCVTISNNAQVVLYSGASNCATTTITATSNTTTGTIYWWGQNTGLIYQGQAAPVQAPARAQAAPAFERSIRAVQRGRSAIDRAAAREAGRLQQRARVDQIAWEREREQREQGERERERAAQAEYEERNRQLIAATARARELLLAHLTPAQRETFEQHGWFVVEGGRSGQRYRIKNQGVAGNIEEIDAGEQITARLCCHINYDQNLPVPDHLLAQKTMLESAEDDFLRIANRSVIPRVAA